MSGYCVRCEGGRDNRRTLPILDGVPHRVPAVCIMSWSRGMWSHGQRQYKKFQLHVVIVILTATGTSTCVVFVESLAYTFSGGYAKIPFPTCAAGQCGGERGASGALPGIDRPV
jgi:hypothetical protein